MRNNTTILGMAGSLRNDSYNRAALRAAQDLAPAGATIEIFDLQGIPPFNQDDEQHPPVHVADLRAGFGRRMPSCWSRRSITTRFRACSRMRSTGRRAPTGTVPGTASPSP